MVSGLASLGILGIDGYVVTVEALLSVGVPQFNIVGLPDASVKEARDRVRAVIKTCGYEPPLGHITVNLAPGDTKKEGPVYDLAILLGILHASEQLKHLPDDTAYIGELALGGELRPLAGVLPMAFAARQSGIKTLFCPHRNAPEAALVDGLRVYGAAHASEVIDHLNGVKPLAPASPPAPSAADAHPLDYADVKGQESVKRALEVAAAGGHNILLSGPPGSGKSMLARRLPTILPRMTRAEALEVSKIHSVAGTLPPDSPIFSQRPFRSPHHTVSPSGLTGGGSSGVVPRPGEFSLAHGGVLFMDEFPEFDRRSLESLRQPLEDGVITLTRVSGTVSYPARFMLVTAMNPCRCGWYGHPTRKCTCTDGQLAYYRTRLSGPILDRIDMRVDVPSLRYDELSQRVSGRGSAELRDNVERARSVAIARYAALGVSCNAHLPSPHIQTYCKPDDAGALLLKTAFDRLGLTARSYDRILRLSRTIADLDGAENVASPHIAEALQYRGFESSDS